jgi:putative aminopeptidase FrvX
VNVIGVLSRAEEVGFHGALALAASGKLPKDGLIVSLETSRELPPARMGQGVIVRVGDRASIFGAAESRFLAEAATDLAKQDPNFQFQRALMSGGTCEATAYQEFGYRCAAVCVALGNYHNCGKNNRIAAEFVSLRDAESMSALLRRSASEMKNWRKLTGRLPKRLEAKRLEGYLREARKRLKSQKLSQKR